MSALVDNVSNSDIFNALMELKGDVGGIMASNDTLVKGLDSHGLRITTLENYTAQQRGRATVWGVVATFMAAIVGGVVQFFRH